MRRVDDALVAVRTLVAVTRGRLSLRRGGIGAAVAAFGLAGVPPRPGPDPRHWTPRDRRVAQVATRVLRTPPVATTCLPTALALADVLRRYDVPSDVVLGVSARDGFTAHAWVELAQGRIDPSRLPLDAHREISRFRHRGTVR